MNGKEKQTIHLNVGDNDSNNDNGNDGEDDPLSCWTSLHLNLSESDRSLVSDLSTSCLCELEKKILEDVSDYGFNETGKMLDE
eukprot:Awhi_evm1s13275